MDCKVIVKWLTAAGCEVDVDSSRVSESSYVTAGVTDGDGEVDEVRIRISRHAARPTYEQIHPFDVGVSPAPDDYRNQTEAAAAAIRFLGLALPNGLVTALGALDKRRAAKAAKAAAAEQARRDKQQSAVARADAEFAAFFGRPKPKKWNKLRQPRRDVERDVWSAAYCNDAEALAKAKQAAREFQAGREGL
jgi:hypothetical protein